MDFQEKLVELLQDENNPVWRWFPNNMAMLQLADYLIANGVTAQEWISVTERLPEKQADVVALSNKNGGYMFVGYRGYISGEWMENGALHIGDVTHWMPIPEPPKGDSV